MASSRNISVVDDLKDAAQDVDIGTNEEVIGVDGGDLLFLQENASVLNIEHLDGFENGEVEDTIGSNNISLLIVPLHLKCKLLLAKLHSVSALFLEI